jgi:hypothetical protein
MLQVVPSVRLFLCLGVAALFACPCLSLSARSSGSDSRSNTQNPDALVREVIRNEIQAQLNDKSLWCYRQEEQEDGKPSKSLEVCQTKDGDLERVVAVNGRELDAAQIRAEDQRIQALVAHPEQLRAKQKKAREDGEQERNMLRIFPEAFRFECESETGNLITLRFKPNPGFRPNTRASLVFHHMEGTLTLNREEKRLVEINGRLTSEVKFLGGLLGHLDKDGTFVVKQQEVGDGHWDLSYMSVHMGGKALFFKTITVLEKKSLADYKPLPRDVTLQQAADFLRSDFDVHTASSSGK